MNVQETSRLMRAITLLAKIFKKKEGGLLKFLLIKSILIVGNNLFIIYHLILKLEPIKLYAWTVLILYN